MFNQKREIKETNGEKEAKEVILDQDFFKLIEAQSNEDQNLKVLMGFQQGLITEEEIAKHFERLIYFVIHRYHNTHQPHVLLAKEDCYNICLFKLFKVLSRYDTKRGKVSTYLVRAMMSDLVDEYKKNHRAKRVGDVISLDDYKEIEKDDVANFIYFKYQHTEFVSDILFQEMKKQTIQMIQDLSAQEKSKRILIDLFIHQKLPKDISKHYGVSPQGITYLKKTFGPRLRFEMERQQLI